MQGGKLTVVWKHLERCGHVQTKGVELIVAGVTACPLHQQEAATQSPTACLLLPPLSNLTDRRLAQYLYS